MRNDKKVHPPSRIESDNNNIIELCALFRSQCRAAFFVFRLQTVPQYHHHYPRVVIYSIIFLARDRHHHNNMKPGAVHSIIIVIGTALICALSSVPSSTLAYVIVNTNDIEPTAAGAENTDRPTDHAKVARDIVHNAGINCGRIFEKKSTFLHV